MSDVAVDVVPKPQNLVDRTNTIVVHRKNPTAWQSQSRQLRSLLDSYATEGGAGARCEPGDRCPFPVGLVSDNCSATDFFGYREGAPCVALVFRRAPDWTPQPLAPSDLASPTVPDEVREGYDPGLLYVTCKSEHISRDIDIRYSPYHGFPASLLPGYPAPAAVDAALSQPAASHRDMGHLSILGQESRPVEQREGDIQASRHMLPKSACVRDVVRLGGRTSLWAAGRALPARDFTLALVAIVRRQDVCRPPQWSPGGGMDRGSLWS
ncbi:hypothetical protein MRX96_054878 [Rhipicephalus microplus]